MNRQNSFIRSTHSRSSFAILKHQVDGQSQQGHGVSSSDFHTHTLRYSRRQSGTFVGRTKGTTLAGSASPHRKSTGALVESGKPSSAGITGGRTMQNSMHRLNRPTMHQRMLDGGYSKTWLCPHSYDKSPYVEENDEGYISSSRNSSYKVDCLHKGLPVIEPKRNKSKKEKKPKDESPTDVKGSSKELTSEQVDTLLQMADMFDRMKTTVTDHDERMGEYQAILGQVETAVQGLRKTLGTCQLIWKIEGFKTKFKEAAKGDNTVLYSPAFETHPYGYKLALSLCPYGDGSGKGKYMSIFFTILQGQWDSLLNWPFGYKVTFTLLDQSDAEETRDILAHFEPNPIKENMPFLGRPTSYRNPSLGLPKFAPLTEVWSGEKYVKDNTIFIKVEVQIREAIGI